MRRRLAGDRLDAAERARVRDLVHGVLRHRGLLDHVIAAFSRRPLGDLERSLIWSLRIGVFGLLRPGPMPAAIAVQRSVDLLPGRKGIRGYANATLRAVARSVQRPIETPPAVPDDRSTIPFADGGGVRLRTGILPDPASDLSGWLAAAYSHPPWIVDRWRSALGDAAAIEALRAGTSTPPFTLRVNLLRTRRGDLRDRLRRRGVEAENGRRPESMRVRRGRSVLSVPEFAEGLFYVQDEMSMQVVSMLDLRPGLRVLDLCAAPGGKSSHIAEGMRDEGIVIACDVSRAKVSQIEANRRRLGHRSIRPVLIGPEDDRLPFRRPFDRILVDAPCSNSGVFRRRPEARWRLGPAVLDDLRRLQESLLDRAAPLIAPGGRIVYSVCAIEPEEGEEVIRSFLEGHGGTQRIEEARVPPTVGGPDGGFIASIGRGR